VADTTLFCFMQYIGVGRYEYVGHTLFLLGPWGLRCGCTLKITGSLLAKELSCCDCLGLKAVEESCYAPNRTRTHVSHIRGSNGHLNVSQFKLGTVSIIIQN
jgi:hypothetical protein